MIIQKKVYPIVSSKLIRRRINFDETRNSKLSRLRLQAIRINYRDLREDRRRYKAYKYQRMFLKKRLNFYLIMYPPSLDFEEFREVLFSLGARCQIVTSNVADAAFGELEFAPEVSLRHLFDKHTIFITCKDHHNFYSIYQDPIWIEKGYHISFTPLIVCYKKKLYTIPSWERFKEKQKIEQYRLQTESAEEPNLFHNIVLNHNKNFNSIIINFSQPFNFLFSIKVCLAAWTILNFSKTCQQPINTQKELESLKNVNYVLVGL